MTFDDYIKNHIERNILTRNKHNDLFDDSFHVEIISIDNFVIKYKYWVKDHYLEDSLFFGEELMKKITRDITIDDILGVDEKNI